MIVHTAACTPDVQAPARPAAAHTLVAKLRDVFAVLHDIQWRAPWNETRRYWINLR